MTGQSSTSLAGGFLLCIALLTGSLTGVYLGPPSIGFLTGAGIGLVLVMVIWLLDRRRRR